jgi:hypothetical protein
VQSVERAQNWLDRVREPSLSALVAIQIIALFVVGPLEDAGLLSLRSVNLLLPVLALVSIFIAARDGPARWVLIASFVATLTVVALRLFFVADTVFPILETAASLLFIIVVTGLIGRAVFFEGEVTVHRIQGAVAIYLNIALAFGILDNMISRLIPGAYSNLPEGPRHLGVMIYFSLTTITTTGYGDIAPIHPIARGMANLEAVMGQLYLAILVATLVGMRVSHRFRQKTNGGADADFDMTGPDSG